MNIAIVFYSLTGVTAKILDRAAEALRAKGQHVIWHRVGQPASDLEAVRHADGYIFASPVHALTLPAVMDRHVRALESVNKGTTAFVLVTQSLWTPRLGGNRAANRLRYAAEHIGAHVHDVTIVSNNSSKQAKTDAFIKRAAEIFR